jgi:ribosomal protein S1
MVVIGSQGSSNTKQLAGVCNEVCKHVFWIEQAADLPQDICQRFCSVGVTAGASTPAFIIKEVVNTMMDEKNLNQEQQEPTQAQTGELTFAEEFEKSFKTLNSGDVVTGIVAGIAPNEIHVDLGTKHDGYIPISEFSHNPEVNPEDMVKVGDEIEVFVVRVNDVEGTIMLSKKKVDSIRGWIEIEKAYEEGAVLDGTIIEAIKGGVITLVNGLRVFVPASLAAERYTSDLNTLVGQSVRLKIIEINKQRRRVTGSIKVVLDEERKEKSQKIWSEIEEGKTYQGVVKSLTSYGAFVDIGGVDGMVHISELSWGRIRHPGEALSVGDVIEVRVLSANPETKKISLGYKKAEENPWTKFQENYKVNDLVEVRIVKLMPFGAFAEVIPGIDGLIHISQIADQRIAKPGDVLSVDQKVMVRITAVDLENQKVNLTIRGLHETTPEQPEQEQVAPVEPTPVMKPEEQAPAPEEILPVTADRVMPGLSEEEAHADMTTLQIDVEEPAKPTPEATESDAAEGATEVEVDENLKTEEE